MKILNLKIFLAQYFCRTPFCANNVNVYLRSSAPPKGANSINLTDFNCANSPDIQKDAETDRQSERHTQKQIERQGQNDRED